MKKHRLNAGFLFLFVTFLYVITATLAVAAEGDLSYKKIGFKSNNDLCIAPDFDLQQQDIAGTKIKIKKCIRPGKGEIMPANDIQRWNLIPAENDTIRIQYNIQLLSDVTYCLTITPEENSEATLQLCSQDPDDERQLFTMWEDLMFNTQEVGLNIGTKIMSLEQVISVVEYDPDNFGLIFQLMDN